jgi:hypothetical protein
MDVEFHDVAFEEVIDICIASSIFKSIKGVSSPQRPMTSGRRTAYTVSYSPANALKIVARGRKSESG